MNKILQILLIVIFFLLLFNINDNIRYNTRIVKFVNMNLEFIERLDVDDYRHTKVLNFECYMLKHEPSFPIPNKAYMWTDVEEFHTWRDNEILRLNRILDVYDGLGIFLKHDL